MQITIQRPPNFSWDRTVLSHGWYSLLPFEFDEKTSSLTRVLERDSGSPLTVRVSKFRNAIKIEWNGSAGQRTTAAVTRDVRHMLRLDDDLTGFYSMMSADPDFAWVTSQGAGRLLRSPTVFEDLVKMICTTNCSWALTKSMVTGLVGHLGRKAPDGRKAFPTPAAMACVTEDFYRNQIRAGYRAGYLKALAEQVAAGSLDVERWMHSELPTAELKREMKQVKGVGDYAAENLLKLVGRYDGLALDSWTRAKFASYRNARRTVSDRKIGRFYSKFKTWQGLALWCDLTRDWLQEEPVP